MQESSGGSFGKKMKRAMGAFQARRWLLRAIVVAGAIPVVFLASMAYDEKSKGYLDPCHALLQKMYETTVECPACFADHQYAGIGDGSELSKCEPHLFVRDYEYLIIAETSNEAPVKICIGVNGRYDPEKCTEGTGSNKRTIRKADLSELKNPCWMIMVDTKNGCYGYSVLRGKPGSIR